MVADPRSEPGGDGDEVLDDDEEIPAWCEECEELVDEEDIPEDGTCPRCGSELVAPERRRVPWYFRLMVVASVVYLGYRAYQGVTWVVHHV
ncbi:MAG: hypothetical protein ACYCU7_18220 [Acidimicrobiales bacterium]